MALLAIQDASQVGLANITFSAATGGGDTVPNSARCGGWSQGVGLIVKNADAATKTVTATYETGVTTQIVVPATTGIGVLPILGMGAGTVAITYSAVTSVTVAAVKVA